MADKRLLDNWLAAYLEYTSDLESPESFHMWTALGTLSAATRRHTSLVMNYGTIYPNLYIIMVAASAELRKSTAANVGRKILLDTIVDINVMQDSMTSQGLTKSLNHKRSAMENGVVVEKLQSDVVIYADEVANLFSYDKLRAAQMSIFLTTTYECPDVYEHTTSRDNKIRLYNMYTTLIGCTDPKNLRTIPAETSDGLVGRLLWVIESKRRNANSGWVDDDKNQLRKQLLREALIHDLRRITQVHGAFKVETDARQYYDDWYYKLAKNENIDQDSKAFYHRCHATVLRIAMLLSLAKREDLTITLDDMHGGLTLINEQLPANQKLSVWKGATNYEALRAKYVSFLQAQPGKMAVRSKVLKHMGVVADEFDRVTATLAQDGTIAIADQKVGGHTVIKLLS